MKMVRRPYPPLFSSLILGGCGNASYFTELVPTAYCMKDYVHSENYFYYSLADWVKAQKMITNWWHDERRLDEIKRLFNHKELVLTEAAKKDFKQWSRAYEAYMPAVLLVFAADRVVSDRVRRILAKKADPTTVEKLMDHLNIPLQDNFYKKEEYNLVTTKNLKSHVKRYEWIDSRYGEIKPYTIDQAKKKLDGIDKKLFLTSWKKQKAQVTRAITHAKRLLSAKDRVTIDLMQYIVYYRTQRTDIMNRSQYLYAPKLKTLARARGLTYKELLYCTKDEVLGKVPPRRTLQQRVRDHATILEEGRVYCVTGNESVRIRRMFEEKIKSISEITGKVAYTGRAKGKVRLVFSTKDFFHFKAGEILITSMTNPHMVPIMKKAAAFVTDEGGITCHAAIMSRELKKPCIIATKFATKIFKDGDLVEVDANAGIVRKL